ncbi:MAG: VPLPA-CTERM sorting domain-containing protein [Pseudomonadota bacterium]
MKRIVPLLLSLFWPLTAHAALITEEDRMAFMTANPLAELEDFNFITSDQSFRNSAVSVNDLTFSVTGSTPFASFVYRIDARPIARVLNISVENTTQANFGLTSGTVNTISFARPVTAFGADFANLGTSSGRTTISAGGDSIDITSRNPGFFGFSSATPFSSVSFTSNQINSVNLIALDNVLYAPVPVPVPVPATLPLLLVGLGGLVALRRRKRAM